MITSGEPPSRHAIQRLVVQEAHSLGIPAALALAVARVESNFNPNAQSPKGARGVMQIMPATARGEYGIAPQLLWQPRLNIRLGLHFLKRLLQRYRGRVDLALSYYNGGSRVGVWPHARVIPATRDYVIMVQRLRYRYTMELRQTPQHHRTLNHLQPAHHVSNESPYSSRFLRLGFRRD